jgi:hypothetical protein
VTSVLKPAATFETAWPSSMRKVNFGGAGATAA